MERWPVRPRRKHLTPEGFIPRCQPVLTDRIPVGPLWIHEIKHDGIRIIARRHGDRVRLWTRSAVDWASRFTSIVEGVRNLPHPSLILDGEAVCFHPDGHSNF